MDWSHLWLPYKGKNNRIKVNSEPLMKYIVTEMEAPNESMNIAQEMLRNYFLESDIGFYHAYPLHVSPNT